ncbi:MAG: hypothetical protein GWN71_43150 [Gammaproteobacteria bacterium]|nr:hypothetical protein [Gemmatimonadota bacterium]NIU80091.1 hypothetical protein [Gammaproteobacteria bacterium]
MNPLVTFDLGDDVAAVGVGGVGGQGGYTFTLRIEAVADDVARGTFAGTDFSVGAISSPEEHPSDVTGTFRARIVRS